MLCCINSNIQSSRQKLQEHLESWYCLIHIVAGVFWLGQVSYGIYLRLYGSLAGYHQGDSMPTFDLRAVENHDGKCCINFCLYNCLFQCYRPDIKIMVFCNIEPNELAYIKMKILLKDLYMNISIISIRVSILQIHMATDDTEHSPIQSIHLQCLELE